jgi:hypothetical protein
VDIGHIKRRNEMEAGEDVKPVSVKELLFAMSVFENAALMKTPRPNVENRRTTVIDEKGKATTYKIADRKQNRGLIAVIDHYKEQKIPDEDRHAMSWRIMSVGEVLNHPSCKEWKKESDGVLQIDDAVIETLASFPMKYGEEIEMEEFFGQVEVTAKKAA